MEEKNNNVASEHDGGASSKGNEIYHAEISVLVFYLSRIRKYYISIALQQQQ